jgi:hypothetical protein
MSEGVSTEESSTLRAPSTEENNEEEESNIAKALRFWKHPSLRDIPMEQKRHYLYEKGVTDAQIHKAWDRILEEKPEDHQDSSNHPQQNHPEPSSTPQTHLPPQHLSANRYLNQQQQHPSPPIASYPSQDPYHSSQYSAPYPPRYEEDEGPGPFLQGVSLVALGGFVGLTAAAGARWLNGGDFQLLPPPAQPGDHNESMKQQQSQRLVFRGTPEEDRSEMDDAEGDEAEDDNQMDTVEEDYITDEEDMDDGHFIPEAQEKLLHEIQSMSESLKAHVSLQEKILQKLTSQGSSITNHSMELLRASSGVSIDREDDSRRSPEILLLWAQLLEIKNELRNLQNGGSSDEDSSSSQVAALLSKLEETIDSIQNSLVSHSARAKLLLTPSTGTTAMPPPPAGVSAGLSSSAPPVKTPGTLVKEEESSSGKEENVTVAEKSLSLRQSVQEMVTQNDATTLRVGSQLLYLYIINLTGNPSNPRYRKIFTTNESFQKVEAVAGGKELLLAVGFEERKGCLEWLASNPSPEAEGLAMAKLQEAAAALGILKSGKPSADLTQRVLAVVTPDPDVQLLPPPLPPPTTPDGTSLISLPQHIASEEDEGKSDGSENNVADEVHPS